MPGYRQLRDDGAYSPPQQPYHQPADLGNSELQPLNYPTRSRSPSFQQTESLNSYSSHHNPQADNIAPRGDIEAAPLKGEAQLKTYKRRYFGLAELILLNFAIGWGYAAPGVVSTTATQWFGISYAMLNNLSIASSLVFLIPAPFVIWVLNRHGPKKSIMIAAVLTVLGNWIVYGATRAKSFEGNIVGTVISALAAPFIMAAPTRHSRQWFSDRSRTIATAAQSLAYPLGAGFGALTGPYMVEPVGPMNYAEQALLIALVFTVVSLPVGFIPKEPPTPPSVVAAAQRLRVKDSLKSLGKNKPFFLLLFSFAILAGSVDTLTATTNQAIAPYGYAQQAAGIALAMMIFIGVLAALIVSPILDKTKKHVLGVKILSALISIFVTVLPFIPKTRSIPGLFIIYALIGIAVLPIQPAILETQADWTHPVSPEFSSFICWSGAKVIAAVFTVVAGKALMLDEPKNGHPEGSIYQGQLFVAIMCWLTVPCLLLMGVWKFKKPAHTET